MEKWKKKTKLKNLGVFLLFGIFFLFLISFISAIEQPTQQYNKIFLSPFYVGSTTQNVGTSFILNVNPPDKIKNVISAVINFDVWMTPSVNFTLLVNNQSCVNHFYYISTTYASAGKSMISYDCSNIIKSTGNYTLVLKATKNTGALTGWLDLTYMNNPKGVMEIFGTEYYSGETAKIWLQLLDNNGVDINNGVCYLSTYFPNNTKYIINASMNRLNENGVYYYDLITPSIEGVFPSVANCYYTASQDFNFATSITMINGSFDSGNISFANVSDGNYDALTSESPSANGTPRRYLAHIRFNKGSICGNIDELLLNGISIYWVGRWNSVLSDYMTISVYNYSSSSWISLPNTIIGSGTGSKSVSNSLFFKNITKAGLVNSSTLTNLLLKFEDTNATDGTTTGFDYDYLAVSCNGFLTSDWHELKGSSEMNIHSPSSNLSLNINYSQIAENVWNYTNRNLTYYADVTNYSNISWSVWNWAGSVSSSILDFFSNSVWTNAIRNLTFTEDVTNYSKVAEYVWVFENRNLTFYQVNNLSVEDIWSYMDRNLTFYDDMTNYSRIAEDVWMYVNRNLTTYPINNISVEDIWNYYNRSLTEDIPLQIWNYPNRNLTTDIPMEVWNYYNRSLTYYTLNLTDLLDMINEYEFTDTPILYPEFESDQYVSNSLNVILVVPS